MIYLISNGEHLKVGYTKNAVSDGEIKNKPLEIIDND